MKKIRRELKRLEKQATEVVKENRNESSKEVNFYKGKLSAIGIGYDDEHAKLKVPSVGESTQDFKWNWLTSTTDSNPDQVNSFKKIIEILEAKNNPELYQQLVTELNVNTKNALEANIREHNITVPTQQINKTEILEAENTSDLSQKTVSELNTNDKKVLEVSEVLAAPTNTVETNEDTSSNINVAGKVTSGILSDKVKLVNGAEFEVKKIMNLLDKPNSEKQLINILDKLLPEDRELIEKEIALKLAYVSNSDIDKYDVVHQIVDSMPTEFIQEFNRCDALTLDQMRAEEAKLIGTGGDSYLV